MFLAMIIMTVVSAVYGAVSTAVSDTGRQKVMKKATNLANQVTRNEKMKSELIDAYNKRDYDLANQILIASPFSGAYKTLVQEKERINQEFEQKKTQIDNLSDDMNKELADVNSHSSASGVIGGTQAHLAANEAKDDYSGEINKLVSGGVTNISDKKGSLGAIKDPVKK